MSIKDIQNKLFQSRLQAKKLFVKFYCNNFTYTFIYSLIVIRYEQITKDMVEEYILTKMKSIGDGYNLYYNTNSYKIDKYDIIEETKNMYFTYPKYLQ